MRDYCQDLLRLWDEDKCQKCIFLQEELRKLLRSVEDSQLKGKVVERLLDHDLHYKPECEACAPADKKTEFLGRSDSAHKNL